MNVQNASPLFLDVKEGLWAPREFTYRVKNRTRRLLHYLSDSGYPAHPIFVQPHPNPNTIKKTTSTVCRRPYASRPSDCTP